MNKNKISGLGILSICVSAYGEFFIASSIFIFLDIAPPISKPKLVPAAVTIAVVFTTASLCTSPNPAVCFMAAEAALPAAAPTPKLGAIFLQSFVKHQKQFLIPHHLNSF